MNTTLIKPYHLEIVSPEESKKRLARINAAMGDGLLSDRERGILSRFSAEKRKIDWLGGRLAAKKILQPLLANEGRPLPLERIEILNREDGVPYVSLPDEPEYLRHPLSISHTSAAAVAAVAQPGHLVGVDAEMIERREKNFLDLVSHESERDEEFISDAAEQTRVWTLKEAVSKVLGTGLSVGFYDIRFPSNSIARRLELHGPALDRWRQLGKPVIRFDTFDKQDHILSIAYTTGDAHV